MPVWRGEGDFLTLLKADPEVTKRPDGRGIEACFDLDYHFKHVDTIFRGCSGLAKRIARTEVCSRGLENFTKRCNHRPSAIRGCVMLSEKLLAHAFTRAVRQRDPEDVTARGQAIHLRRWRRAEGRHPVHRHRRPARAVPSSRTEDRRALRGRPPHHRGGLHLRPPAAPPSGHPRRSRTSCPCGPAQDPHADAAAQRERRRKRSGTSPITTISTGGSTRSFSTATGNIPAPISSVRTPRLEEAQLAKKRHITAKLLVEPGHSVLDIGSGWGGLGLYLAQAAGAGLRARRHPVGGTARRLAQARRRRPACPSGFGSNSRITAATTGNFDRIVSVGMFEHVGVAVLRRLFRRLPRASSKMTA